MTTVMRRRLPKLRRARRSHSLRSNRKNSSTFRLCTVCAHRARERLVSDRTRLINQGRGFLMERGIRVGTGRHVFQKELARLAAEGASDLSTRMRLLVTDIQRRPALPLRKGARRLIGRTNGGMNTKLHAICDSEGRPIDLFVMAAQVSDYIGARAARWSVKRQMATPG